MNRKYHPLLCTTLALLIVMPAALHAKPKKAPPTPLTAAGEKAQQNYAQILVKLRSQLKSKVPKIDSAKWQKFTEES